MSGDVERGLRTNLMRAVVLVITLEHLALETSPDLSTDADTVPNFDGSDLGTDFDGLADYLVTNTERERRLSPTAGDGVNIGSTDTACILSGRRGLV